MPKLAPARAIAVPMIMVGLGALVASVAASPSNAESAAARTVPPDSAPHLAEPVGSRVTPPASAGDSIEGGLQEEHALLEVNSARLEDRVVPAKPEPVGLRIGALGVTAPIEPVGAASNVEMEVPGDIATVAWYRFGPAPGQAGSAVLAAHVDLARQGPGVFFALRTLEQGDDIVVDFADGSVQRFLVTDAATYGKDELDSLRIFARTGPPTLTLVTCGGGFNPSLKRYDSNVVVYAVPARSTPGHAR